MDIMRILNVLSDSWQVALVYLILLIFFWGLWEFIIKIAKGH